MSLMHNGILFLFTLHVKPLMLFFLGSRRYHARNQDSLVGVDGWWRWTGMVSLVTGWQQTEAHKPWLNGLHLLSVERLCLLGRAAGWVPSEALGEALRWCFSAVILELKHWPPLRFLSKLVWVSGWCWMETPRCKCNFPKNKNNLYARFKVLYEFLCVCVWLY